MENKSIRQMVEEAVAEAKVTDIHSHLYPRDFGELMLWGIDEVLTYHYLTAEALLRLHMPCEQFWALSKSEQADLVWQTLFLEHSPLSEACRGVLTALDSLGLDVSSRDLDSYRDFFNSQDVGWHTDRVFELSRVEAVVMTNDPFDHFERDLWMKGVEPDSRFKAALRVDVLLNLWDTAAPKLKELGYQVKEDFGGQTVSEIRRFLTEWVQRMDALYMAVSLEPGFRYPQDTVRGRLIDECVLPVCRDPGIPFAMMIGVTRRINPELSMAGDSVSPGCKDSVARLCACHPENKFLVTMLARENQHELCVTARKFRNLMVFGCWWFLNVPSMIEEITRMRLELLGLRMIPQHSDSRVLEQLIYKWGHSRRVIGAVLADKYEELSASGWQASEEEIQRDVADLFGGNFWRFLGRKP